LCTRSATVPCDVNHDVQFGLIVPLRITPAPQLDVARAQATRNQTQLDAQRAQMKSELQFSTRAQRARETAGSPSSWPSRRRWPVTATCRRGC